jgi:hypothetical protein
MLFDQLSKVNVTCTGVIDWKPGLFWRKVSRNCRRSIHGIVSTCACCPYLPCCTWKNLILIILTSKRTSAQSESPTPFLGFWFKFKILGSEFHTSDTYSKRAKQATRKDNRLSFLNYLAFLRPEADGAVSILPWVVSPGHSYGFVWAVRLLKKMWGRTIQLRLIRQ